MITPSYLLPLGVAAIVAAPFQTAQALNSTEVSEIAEAVTVQIEGQNSGSGVIIKQRGNIYTVLTAAHVVATPDEYGIITADQQQHPLNYSDVKKLPNVDLALVEFTSSKKYPVAELGDSNSAKVGASIYVSGFPLPTAAITESIWTFSKGEITANSKRPLADGYALVYSNNTLPGMSGGAVLNSEGKLIGIHGRADAQQQEQKTETVYVKTGFNLGIPVHTFLGLAATVSPELGFTGEKVEPTSTALTADDWFLQAGDKIQKGNYQAAISDFDQAIALNPDYAEAYFNRGNAYAALKQYPQAISDFDRAIALNPDYTYAYNSRGTSHLAAQQFPQAIADYDQAIVRYQKALEEGNKVKKASTKASQERVAEYAPNITEAIQTGKSADAAKLLLEAGRKWLNIDDPDGRQALDKELKNFHKVRRIEADLAQVYVYRGIANHSLTQYDSAIADYNKAIAIDSKFTSAYVYRGMSYHLLKQYPRAIADYRKVINVNPKVIPVLSNLGLLYYEQNNIEAAITQLKQAISLDSTLAEPQLALATAYAKQGNQAQATQLAKAALRIDPKLAQADYQRKNGWGDRLIADTQKLIATSSQNSVSP